MSSERAQNANLAVRRSVAHGTYRDMSERIKCPVCGKPGVQIFKQVKHRIKQKTGRPGFFWQTTYCELQK